MAFRLTNTANVADDATLKINGAYAIESAVVAGTTYLFVAGRGEGGLSVFSTDSNGALTNVANVSDDITLRLAGIAALATAVIGGTTYLFTGSLIDDGLSVFSVASNGVLTNVANVTDDATLKLDATTALATAVIGGTTYLFAGGFADNGVSVFSVANNGTLVNVANVSDDGTLQLQNVTSLSTAVIGGTTYLFAAGGGDDGVSVLSVGSNGALTNASNVHDDATLNLNDARSVTTAVIGGTTYLFVAGRDDQGISVFSVDSNGALTNVANVSDDATMRLSGVDIPLNRGDQRHHISVRGRAIRGRRERVLGRR